MSFRHFHHHSSADKINVTPLIDVVMVLIVFYLIVGKLATDSSARVELPRTPLGAQQQDRGLVISLAIDDQGQQALTLDGNDITLDQLTSELTLRMPELATGTQSQPISLRADRRFSFGEVQPIVAACKAAGVTSLKLITTRSATQRGTP